MLIILPLVLAVGCSDFGKVDQGRAVKFDKEKRVVTIIRDVKNDSQNPEYTHLPPLNYALPDDPGECGPEPKVGGRMKIDTKAKQITIFDPASQNFKTIDYTLIDQKDNVDKNDPLVYNSAEKKAKPNPVVDRDKKTITIYSARQKSLTTFSLPPEYFALPDNTWDSGDEVRVYYKEAGKASRFMNVSKTDIYKK
ncbi:MAG: DUF4881 domain-containing protein [Syntrophobacteraceae bacterium]|nr:DUF4881 domain-containing protein [Desulfobacteraceae bacterium]